MNEQVVPVMRMAPRTGMQPGTRIERVMASIRQRIVSRSLVPGARLPSVRALAKTMQVSPSTDVEAYDRMVADGTIVSRPGSGFFVAGSVWRAYLDT